MQGFFYSDCERVPFLVLKRNTHILKYLCLIVYQAICFNRMVLFLFVFFEEPVLEDEDHDHTG